MYSLCLIRNDSVGIKWRSDERDENEISKGTMPMIRVIHSGDREGGRQGVVILT